MKTILYKLNTNNNPIFLGSSFIIDLALKDPATGLIYTVSPINYQLVTGNAILTLLNTNSILIGCNQLSKIIIELSYYDISDGTTSFAFISFTVTKNLYQPTLSLYQDIINSEFPQGYFNNTPLDAEPFAQLLLNVYGFGIATFDNAFPTVSTNQAWIKTLWSTSQPLYIGNNNLNYNDFITFLRNISTNCTLNPFDLAWNISKFLYFVSGKIYYVYANEEYSEIAPNYTIYIIDPTAGTTVWILGTSILGTNTILGDSSLLDVYKNDIEFFTKKIIRASTNYKIDYNNTLSSLDLVTFIDNTYIGDIRLNGVYCIAYNVNNFTNATAYINMVQYIVSESDDNLITESSIEIIEE